MALFDIYLLNMAFIAEAEVKQMPEIVRSADDEVTRVPLAGIDNDIQSPVHDEILLWFDKNAEQILPNLFPWAFATTWSGDAITAIKSTQPADAVAFSRFGGPPERRVELRKEWQYPIIRYLGPQKAKTIMGFVDLKINVLFSFLTFTPDGGWEVTGPGGAPGLTVYCEAASTIQLSRLLRQLKAYKEWVQTEPCSGDQLEREAFVVISPDDRYIDKLSEEGFHFVKYDPALFA